MRSGGLGADGGIQLTSATSAGLTSPLGGASLTEQTTTGAGEAMRVGGGGFGGGVTSAGGATLSSAATAGLTNPLGGVSMSDQAAAGFLNSETPPWVVTAMLKLRMRSPVSVPEATPMSLAMRLAQRAALATTAASSPMTTPRLARKLTCKPLAS